MKASELYGVLVRVLGLLIGLYGLYYLSWGVTEMLGYPQDSDGEMEAFFTAGIFYITAGFVLVRRAESIVRFSYPLENK